MKTKEKKEDITQIVSKCSVGSWLFLILFLCVDITTGLAQREGGLPGHSVTNRLLISDGPDGPIKGGESAVTDMILMDDGWVYGSTKATLGAERAHLFRTDGEDVQHMRTITSEWDTQTSVSDLARGKNNILIGSTSTYDEIFDSDRNQYPGGHLFSFDPSTGELEDLGILSAGQGINCIAVDTTRGVVYGVTYPEGHLFSYDLGDGTKQDYGEIMTPWRVEHLGKVSWRGIPKVLMIDDAGTVYFSTYKREEKDKSIDEMTGGYSSPFSSMEGGRIYRLAYGEDAPVFTGAVVPTQKGMDTNPIYENGIASAVRALDGGFWCGTLNDGFLFKFYPSTSTVINKGKAFQYWNLKSMAYGEDGNLYMLGGRDYDNSWLLSYDGLKGSINSLGWPNNTAQASVISADDQGRILIAENRRHSRIWVYDPSK